METTTVRLHIVFEEGFWVGYFERSYGGEYTAARHLFGPEPGAAELSEFVLGSGYDRLLWTRSLPSVPGLALERNPKRLVREVARARREGCAASKARQAVQAEIESRKVERKSLRAARKAQLRDERFVDRRERRKRKRRGH